MTIKEVQDMVNKINDKREDDEAAHILEDRLYISVLEHIAKTDNEYAVLCREALKARLIEYARWCG